MRTASRLLTLTSMALIIAACRSTEPFSPGPVHFDGVSGLTVGDGGADFEEFEVCKYGSAASFIYTIDRASTGPGADTSGSFTLIDGECTVVALVGGLGATVTVTEDSADTGYHFDHAVVTTVAGMNCQNPNFSSTTQTSATVTGTISGSGNDGICRGTLVEFFNVPNPLVGGRMTGGGGQIIIGGVKVSRGFTIHCDIVLSNNLEINWGGNRWHLDKPLTLARCVDDPAISPAPPPAPFDTFYGEGFGRLNGVDSSLVRFVFIDAGEPGGNNDRAQIQVYAPDGTLVLDVPLSFLDRGNLQAHYDQPHK